MQITVQKKKFMIQVQCKSSNWKLLLNQRKINKCEEYFIPIYNNYMTL